MANLLTCPWPPARMGCEGRAVFPVATSECTLRFGSLVSSPNGTLNRNVINRTYESAYAEASTTSRDRLRGGRADQNLTLPGSSLGMTQAAGNLCYRWRLEERLGSPLLVR